MKKKAALHNLGCKVNSYETEAMQQLLEENGHYAGLWNAQQSLENFGTETQSAKTDSEEKNFVEKRRKEDAHEEKN